MDQSGEIIITTEVPKSKEEDSQHVVSGTEFQEFVNEDNAPLLQSAAVQGSVQAGPEAVARDLIEHDELHDVYAPAYTEQQHKEAYGPFDPITGFADKKVRSDMRIVKARYEQVNQAFDDAIKRFTEVSDAAKSIKKPKPEGKKFSGDLEKIIDFSLMLKGKRNMLTELLSNQESSNITQKLNGEQDHDKWEEILLPYVLEYDKTSNVISDMAISINQLSRAVEKHDDTVVFSHFADAVGLNFVNWANNKDPGKDVQDYNALLEGERLRAEMFLSAIRVKPEGERARYSFRKGFVDSYLNSVRQTESSADTEQKLGFGTDYDPIRIGKNLWPDAAMRQDESTRWRTDILYSTRMNFELFLQLACKYADDSGTYNQDEKGLVDCFTGVWGTMMPVFKAVSNAFEKAATQKNADNLKLFSKYVEMSRQIGELFGHMRLTYQSLYKRIEKNDGFTLGETKEALMKQVGALKAMTLNDKGNEMDLSKMSLDDILSLCTQMVKNGEVLAGYADDIIEKEPVEVNDRGISTVASFAIDDDISKEEFEKISDRIKIRHKLDSARMDKYRSEDELFRQIKSEEAACKELEKELHAQLEAMEIDEAREAELRAHQTIHITHLKGVQRGYIPTDAMGHIKGFKDYEGNQITRVGKIDAFFHKKELKGDAIRERMEKHVRLFLSNRDGVTDTSMLTTVNNLFDSCDLAAHLEKDTGLSQVDRTKLAFISRLLNTGLSTDVANIIREVQDAELMPVIDESVELSMNSQFMKDHTDAARMIVLQKLLSTVSEASMGPAVSQEVKDRLLAIRSNVNLMYGALTNGEDYREAMRLQKIEKINKALTRNGELLIDIQAQLNTYTPHQNLTEDNTISQEQVDELNRMVSDTSHAAIKVSTQKARHEQLAKHTVSQLEIDRRLEVLKKDLATTPVLVKKPPKIFDFEVLRARGEEELDLTAVAHFNEGMAACLPEYNDLDEETKAYILNQAKLQIPHIMDGVSDIKNFTEAQMAFFTGTLAGRMSDLVLSREKVEKSREYYRYAIYGSIRGQEVVDEKTWSSKRTYIDMFKDAIMAECWDASFEKGVYVKLKGLQKSSSLSADAMRGERRVDRILNFDNIVTRVCVQMQIEKPQTFYEFCEDNDYLNTGIFKSQDKTKTYDKAVDAYRKYIDSHFKDKAAEIKPAIKIDGQDINSGEKMAGFLKAYFSEYGVASGGSSLCRAMEKPFNEQDNDAYQKTLTGKQLLYRARLSAIKETLATKGFIITAPMESYLGDALYADQRVWEKEQNRLVDYIVQNKRDESVVERTKNRIKALQELNNGQLNDILPILLKNNDFAKSIATYEEDEYLTFLSRRLPRINDVISNMVKYGYIDQYLIERGKEMAEYVMSDETIDVEAHLGLKQLTKDIDDQKIIYEGKTTTLKAAIGLEINRDSHKQEDEMKAFFGGSLVMAVLAKEGPAAILNTKRMDAIRRRVMKNTKELKKVLEDDSLFTKTLKDRTTVSMTSSEKKAALISIYHSERNDILMCSTEKYREKLKERIKKSITVINTNFAMAAKLTEARNEQKTFGASLRDTKRTGREYFRKYTTDSDKMFTSVAGSFNKEIFDSTTIDPQHKALLLQLYNDRKTFLKNPATASLYIAGLKRIVAHLSDKKAEGETDEKDILIKKDIVAMLSLRVFLNATDDFIENKAKPEGLIREADAAAFRSGLMEMYCSQIMSAAVTYTKDDYRKNIEDLFKNVVKDKFTDKKHSLGAVRYIVDDWAGISAVSSESATGERMEDTKTRQDFEKALVKKLNEGQKAFFEKLSNDGKVVFAHFLCQATVGIPLNVVMQNILGLGEGASDSLGVTADAIVMNYLKGESLSADVVMIDYASLTDSIESKQEVMFEPFQLMKEVEILRSRQQLLEREKAEERRLSIDKLHTGMNDAATCAGEFAAQFRKDTRLPNIRKLWRYYTVLRAYALEFDQLSDLKDSELKNGEKEMLEDYKHLQEYVLLLEKQRAWTDKTSEADKKALRDARQKIENRFKDKLGLYGDVLEDEKRDGIFCGIRGYLYEKDSKKAQGELAVLDREERDYPPDVVKAVKQIDKWVAKNTSERLGDTESHFGHEVLSHPFRERLFIYYVIEFKKYEAPSELDAAMALNGYVPNFDLFKKKMERSGFNILHQLSSGGVKDFHYIKKYGLLDSYGANKTHKLEAAMRTLDEPRFDMQGRIRDISDKRALAGRRELPREVRIRESCYMDLVAQIARQKRLLEDKENEEKNARQIEAQAHIIIRSLLRLMAADSEVESMTGMDISQKDYLKQLADRKTFKEPEEEEGSLMDWNGHASTVAGLADSFSDVVDEYQEIDLHYFKIKPWKLNDKAASDLFKSQAVFKTVTGITSIIDTVNAMKEADESEKEKTFSERLLDRVHLMESMSDTVGDMLDIVSHFAPALEDTIENVSGVASAGTQIISGTFETAVALTRKYQVSDAEQESYKYIQIREEAEANDDRNEPEPITREQLQLSVSNVAKMQQRTLTGEAAQGALKLAGGTASMIALLFPVTAPFTETLSSIIGVVQKIHGFWADIKQRKATVDEFIDMDALYEKFMASFNNLAPEVQNKYLPVDEDGNRDVDEIKDMLRKEAVSAMHFSTLEQYFMDISEKYATMLYREIFFDTDGTQLLKGRDEDKIRARMPLMNLFPGMKFGFPGREGDWPQPSIDRLTENLTRSVAGD